MKTKLLILILFICGSARANLIELTPGGFNVNNPPPAFFQFLQQLDHQNFAFFDEATPDGWVSLYGILDGGTYFNTDLIGHPGQSATVNWDFTTLPGYSMSRLLIEGRTPDGSAWANIYAVPYNLRDLDTLQTVVGGKTSIFNIFHSLGAGLVAPFRTQAALLLYSESLSPLCYSDSAVQLRAKHAPDAGSDRR